VNRHQVNGSCIGACCEYFNVSGIAEFELASTGIQAQIIDIAAIRGLQIEFWRATVMPFLNFLERHGARQDCQIQEDREQYRVDPARCRRYEILCGSLNHALFLASFGSQHKKLRPISTSSF